ncbi:pilus assembly protein N-terminal domain-containing protein [Polymorphum gilvum]|uniref:Possible pilus assembly protein (CpaC) n=1 Tax=Polymorphum gilvum (strain LMG 25793 / CGMCC 1.9160 / SL003B-26A1) TaxID=991905 RepID=F2J2R4_POLGS|nr:pilus assembly protein N-terminal domain-containing protein [Polymorphum gilvum]ADZ72088.1 Possible pilus assembly protein (CpaC) [Polymorphum gilvum SL003B-26A1]
MTGAFRPRFTLSAAVFATLLCGAAAAETEPVAVTVDRAKVFRIEAPADTVIVGNPSIADVTMHDRFTVVVTGKTFGTTNLVILDKDSQPIIDEVIVVRPPETDVVTVTRNLNRYSYSCSPTCEPTVRVGDAKDAFELTVNQAAARNEMAVSAAGATR